MKIQEKQIGLIAGNRDFPLLFSRAARDNGYRVVVAAVKGETSPLIHLFANKVKWFSPRELSLLLKYFQNEKVKKVIMVGQVKPDRMIDGLFEDDVEWQDILSSIEDRKTDTFLAAVGKKLAEHGLELIDSTFLLNKYLAPKGTLTKRPPTELELDDIGFGIELAKQMGGIDIGQTVVVKKRGVVAIEAMEGTDKCIARGGLIAREGAVVVKQSKPKQDNRFDVPVIGPKTIQTLAKVKASCLAIEANKTLIIDYDKVISLADKKGICIVSA